MTHHEVKGDFVISSNKMGVFWYLSIRLNSNLQDNRGERKFCLGWYAVIGEDVSVQHIESYDRGQKLGQDFDEG